MGPIRHGLNGLLTTAAALALIVQARLGDPAGVLLPGAVALAAIALWGAGVAGPARPLWGRAVASGAVFAGIAALTPALTRSPSATLATLIVSVGLLGSLWPTGASGSTRPSRRGHPGLDSRAADLRTAWLGTVAIVLGAARTSELDGVLPLLAGALSWTATLRFAAGWCLEAREHAPRRAAGVLALIGLALGVGALAWSGRIPTVLGPVALAPAVLAARRPRRAEEPEPAWTWMLLHPARSLVLTFAGLSALGTLGLLLPGMLEAGRSLSVLDAAFTATSAVCVTGLVVVDTGSTFSPVGELWLLALIQAGALGIMTFGSAAIAVLGGRLSLRHEGVLAEMLSGEDRGALFGTLRVLLLYAFVFEAGGALVLSGLFALEGTPLPQAAWRGLFTAVSAFGNAGFALESESLIAHQGSPAVLHAVALLIVAGGMSPVVALALPRLLRRRPVPLTVRVVWATTVVLLLFGAALIAGIEWRGAFAHLAPLDRIHNAWFQSVTLRTAGFNSVELTTLSASTLTVMMALMFVGGSPGGTAGGIKTTTAAVLVLAVAAAIRGRDTASGFGRRLPHAVVYRAAAITSVGLASGFATVLALELTQALPARELLFEAVSALGTVGLSVGATASLDPVGKLIVMAAMLAGRTGPLTLFLFLRGRTAEPSWRLPEEGVEVG